MQSPKLKLSRPLFGSQRNLLESTPVSDFIRHPAYSKQSFRAVNAASVPTELTKENLHQDQVISPLTQSAQRFPYYVRDSIMTPRCRKPVFTFSPIDEPADDLVPNSDALQLANLNCVNHQSSQAKTEEICTPDKELSIFTSSDTNSLSDDSDSLPTQEKVEQMYPSDKELSTGLSVKELSTSVSSDINSLSDDSDSLPNQEKVEQMYPSDKELSTGLSVKELSTSVSSDINSLSDDSDSFLSGCALINGGVGSLTSPFKSYLMSREIQVYESDEESSSFNKSLLDSEKKISNSLLEFLDGNEPELKPVSSPTRPSPPLTKSILFETSL